MPALRSDVTNVDMLNAIRSDARRDYQEMIPEATKANIQETIDGIMSDNISRNEFLSALFNRIGSEIIRDITWKNPLAVFKGGMLNFGDTIEEVHMDLIRPTIYEENRDYLERVTFLVRLPRPPSRLSTRLTARRSSRLPLTVTSFVVLSSLRMVFLRCFLRR